MARPYCPPGSIPDQTWLTDAIRAWLRERKIAFDGKANHGALVLLAQQPHHSEPSTVIPSAGWVTDDVRCWLRERSVSFDRQAPHLHLVELARRHAKSTATATAAVSRMPPSAREGWVPLMMNAPLAAGFDYSLCGEMLRTGPLAAAAERAAAAGVVRAGEYEAEETWQQRAGVAEEKQRRLISARAAQLAEERTRAQFVASEARFGCERCREAFKEKKYMSPERCLNCVPCSNAAFREEDCRRLQSGRAALAAVQRSAVFAAADAARGGVDARPHRE